MYEKCFYLPQPCPILLKLHWRRSVPIAVGLAISLSVGIVGILQMQKAALREQAEHVHQLLQTDPVTGLMLAIQTAGRNRTVLPWDMLPEVQASLLSAVQIARERTRFDQTGSVYTTTFTPDGQRIAAAGENGNIYLWRMQDRHTQVLQGDGQAIGSIQFSPDGKAVFANPTTEIGTVQFWNLQADSSDLPPARDLASAAFSADGQQLISGDVNGRVQLWTRRGEWIANLYPQQAGEITAAAFAGATIVGGSTEGAITLWSRKGELLGRLWAGARITSLSLDQGGQRLISQDLNRQQAFIWDAQTSRWNQFLLGETATGRSATLNPDNTLIARATLDGAVQVLPLDAHNPRVLPRSFLGHQGAVNTVTFSADGQTIVSGGEDGSVRVWDVWDGTLLGSAF